MGLVVYALKKWEARRWLSINGQDIDLDPKMFPDLPAPADRMFAWGDESPGAQHLAARILLDRYGREVADDADARAFMLQHFIRTAPTKSSVWAITHTRIEEVMEDEAPALHARLHPKTEE